MEINFQHVNFKYDKKQQFETLNDINLQISSKDEFITIVGHTGSGKSTTIASLINQICLNESKHIVTIEDPVEYVYNCKKG